MISTVHGKDIACLFDCIEGTYWLWKVLGMSANGSTNFSKVECLKLSSGC